MIYCLSQVKEIPFQLWEIFSPSRQWAKKTMGNVRSSSYGLILKLIRRHTFTTLEDEAFYIQEGELEFQLGDKTVIATPGTFLYSPKGHLHTFKNITNQRARMLVWYMPAGIENFFAEVGVPVDDPDAPSRPATPEAIERILAVAPKYGIEFIV